MEILQDVEVAQVVVAVARYRNKMRLEIVDTTKQEEKQKARALWKDCFHDTDRYMDFYFSYKTAENIIYGIYDEEMLVSMVQLNPYDLVVDAQELKSYYIVGVATNTAYRKRGLMRKLLNKSLQDMYQEEIPFAYLMPAKEAIYLPFDFRIVTIQKRKSYPFRELFKENPEEMLSAAQLAKNHRYDTECLGRFDEKRCEALAQFANEFLSKREQIYTKRSRYYYERMLAELETFDGKILILLEENEIRGYFAYGIEEGKVEVLEYLCDEEFENILLEELKEKVKADVSNPLLDQEVTASIAPPIMARIINVAKFLGEIRSDQPLHLKIQVEDAIIEQNNGIYQLYVTSTSCDVERANDIGTDQIDIHTDIADFTRLFFGQMSAGEIIKRYGHAVYEKISKIHWYEHVYLNEIV